MQLKVKKNHPDAVLPQKAYKGDAGWDVFSVEDVSLLPQEVREVDIGISIEIPESYFIWPVARSVQRRRGIFLSGGIIDSGYRKNLTLIITNLSKKIYEIKKGDKIGQLIILPNYAFMVREVLELSKSVRGEKGFGSSDFKKVDEELKR